VKVRPKPPQGLGPPGRRLWRALVADLPESMEFDARELALLAAAARQADDIAVLEAVLERDGPVAVGSRSQSRLSAVVPELRQERLAFSRLLGELRLPDGQAAATSSSKRAQRAADARWAEHRARRALRSA
jgi:hypothetical protein